MAKHHILVQVQGTPKAAKRAAARHSIALHACSTGRTGVPGSGSNVSTCYAPCSAMTKVERWHAARGRGRRTPGEVTGYTSFSCLHEDLKGRAIINLLGTPKKRRTKKASRK